MKYIFYIPLSLLILVVWACGDDDFPVPEASIVADFDYAIDNAAFAPATVTFANTSIVPEGKEGVTYNWSFGDGSLSTEASPSHTYQAPGRYEVSLVAIGQAEIRQATRFITIKDPQAVGVSLYFADLDGYVYNALINGSEPSFPALTESPLGEVNSLVIDTINKQVYAVDKGAGTLFRMDYEGNNITPFKSGFAGISGLSIDYDRGRIYWSTDDAVYYADLNSTSPTDATVLISDLGSVDPRGVSVNPADGTVYVNSYDGGIYTVNPDGSGFTTLIEDVLGVGILVANDRLYYHGYDLGSSQHFLRLADLQGNTLRTIATGMDGDVFGIGYDAVNDKVYFNDRRSGLVMRANADGTGVETFIDTNGSQVFAVAVGEFTE